MFSLLLLSSLLHITTCTVYTVTPDDHYYPNTTCHHCHNLQHYLLNVTKYFTSNTQLLFLPGQHHLHTDLIIQNVHNISLIGSTANGTTPSAVIQSNASILILNISKLIIKHILINTNQEVLSLSKYVPLTIKDCSFVSLYCLQVHRVIHSCTHKYLYIYNFAIVAINIMGISYFNHVKCYDDMQLFYNETHTDREQHNLSINNCTVGRVQVNMLQNYYRVTLRIMNIRLECNRPCFIHAKKLGTNKVVIINSRFVSNPEEQMFLFASTSNGSVEFVNCQFIYYTINPLPKKDSALIRLCGFISVKVNNCNFYAYGAEMILHAYGEKVNQIYVVIRNTNYEYTTFRSFFRYSLFSLSYTTLTLMDSVIREDTNYVNTTTTYTSFFEYSLFSLSYTTLTLMNSVNFQCIATFNSILFLKLNSTIIISGTITFSHNRVDTLIDMYDNNKQYIIMKEGSILNISHNVFITPFRTKLSTAKYPFPFCYFQYFTSSTSKVRKIERRSFLIRLHKNYKERANNYELNFQARYNVPITNCLWLEKSMFQNNDDIPLQINNQYIQFINNSGTYTLTQLLTQSSLCVCTNATHYDCNIDDLGYLYPGQSLNTFLCRKRASTRNSGTATAVAVKTDITQQYVTPCIVLDITENIQFISENCTELHYTIGFPTDSWCELFLKIALDSDEHLNIFYIRQITCPNGFVKIDKRCQCDPVLVQYGITNCNINDQTILRPANSWISATTQKNSYTYHTSLHCPFHYCLPHSSHLNFSTPNSQCQFNRSGLLCGHCQQAVLSSSNCQQCSNTFLLLIIPITVTGLVLVLMLFALNLTVTDGTINGFIFYVYIISINTPVFFTALNHFAPSYTFISLANLDLGIQTCFYNGMDDYAKMWLQLAFPFYLIFIATLIIITSRYFTTIQRLTARRALPVLATLFLLSYTKILRIVSSVLFFYSTITHLPSKHTTLVWSVDANVPLFGVRFTILFIVCLILFLILVPFNVILLFTRTLSRFRFINKFKPLLDAYQGPYKNKFYYWTGLQLLMRAVFFGISSLDRNINIAISILLLSAIIGFHGMMQPFKVKPKNYQEMLLFLNLQGIYVTLLYSQDNANLTTIDVAITLAAVQFSFITVYHIITYVYGGVIRNRIELSINTLTGWITISKNKAQTQQFQLQDSIRDNIPEVAFNYREYREPLVGVDC